MENGLNWEQLTVASYGHKVIGQGYQVVGSVDPRKREG